jgi:2-aminoethylphosphonate-pyruvate transaminase
MLRDCSTWDADYNSLVNNVRARIVRLATNRDGYTCVPMQGSGTFAVEAAFGSLVPPNGKILIVNNGAYGQRMVQIADRISIACEEIKVPETEPIEPDRVKRFLAADSTITHVALVHCETTTGLLNPVSAVGRIARDYGKVYLVDAMSSFGGIPLTMEELGAHCLISSANKCIQGVPGFSFVVAERKLLEEARGRSRSLSLDLYDQWREMEQNGGKWRFTSPTHVVCAFTQALDELQEEGGVTARFRRYSANHRQLLSGMTATGFRSLLPPERQSPIISSFFYSSDPAFSFAAFYEALKARRFVLYPGKVSHADTFRIGTIGHVFPEDFDALSRNVAEVIREFGWKLP